MEYKNQINYYWRHREEILKKEAKKRKNPEYRKYKAKLSLKSYHKRKEEKNARTED